MGLLSASLLTLSISQTRAQKPQLTGVDHIGINVPDLDKAQKFFTEVLGFQTVTQIGPIALNQDWKQSNHINPATGPVTIKMVMAGTGANIELFSYSPNKGNPKQPGGDDASATHIALYTPDIKNAVRILKTHGVKFLGEVFTTPSGDTKGESWVYFLTPWNSKMELVSYPEGKGYEKNNPGIKLWSPKNAITTHLKTTDNMEEKDALALVEKHLQIWNEKNPDTRNIIIQQTYAPDIEMIDRHFIANGISEINSFIDGLQQKNPSGKFTMRQEVDTHHNVARLYWKFGEEGKAPAVTGMDIFLFENGKVQKLLVFVDENPG